MSESPVPGGRSGTLTAPRIAFMVIAAVAPMASVIGTMPLSFALGTGAGTPATYAMVGLVLLCFAVGYASMGRYLVSAGGFYAYIRAGLGRVPAVCGGFVAVLSYNAATVGLVAAFGYFGNLTAASLFSVNVPWEVFAAAALVLLAALGRRQIEASVRTLMVLLLAEFLILVILDVAIVIHRGAAALPAASWAPHNAFGGALGVTLMLAFTSYVGFESTSLYGPEARNPRRAIPLATYGAVALITLFYGLTSWIAVGGVGAGQVQKVAGQQLGDMFLALNAQYVNSFTTQVMSVLLCTSILASTLALHNATSRYMSALGKERALPSWLGRARGGAAGVEGGPPANASLAQSAVNVVVVGIAALAGANPYLGLGSTAFGIGAVGLITLQAAAAVSVLAYFWNRRGQRHWWRTFTAPLIGAVGLIWGLVLVVQKFGLLTGSTSPLVAVLPWLVAIAAAAGACWAAYLRSRRPDIYRDLGASSTEAPASSADVAALQAS
jgi:amino acid transporter